MAEGDATRLVAAEGDRDDRIAEEREEPADGPDETLGLPARQYMFLAQ